MRGRAGLEWDDVFFEAALQPDLWPRALDRMATDLGASHGQLVGIGRDRNVPFNLVTNFEPAQIQSYEDIDGWLPDRNFRVAACETGIARGEYDAILHEAHYDLAISDLRSSLYLEWCDEADIPFGCQTNLVVDDQGLIGLAVLRSRREGQTTPAKRREFARAADAARRAVRLQERLEGEQAGFLRGAFESIGITAFVLDQKGRVAAMTASAERLLAADEIRLNGAILEARGTPLNLQKAVHLLLVAEAFAHFRISIDLPSRRRPLVIEGFRLPTREWGFGRQPQAVLIANSPRRDRAGLAQFLTALYRLTPAEADIALRLASGAERAEIADKRGVSSETLRGQIKSVHAKCGVPNEAALMRLLASLVA